VLADVERANGAGVNARMGGFPRVFSESLEMWTTCAIRSAPEGRASGGAEREMFHVEHSPETPMRCL